MSWSHLSKENVTLTTSIHDFNRSAVQVLVLALTIGMLWLSLGVKDDGLHYIGLFMDSQVAYESNLGFEHTSDLGHLVSNGRMCFSSMPCPRALQQGLPGLEFRDL